MQYWIRVETAKRKRIDRDPYEFLDGVICKGDKCLTISIAQLPIQNINRESAIKMLSRLLKELKCE